VENYIVFKMSISDFQNFEFLAPKNPKNDCFKKMSQNKIFQKCCKNQNKCNRT